MAARDLADFVPGLDTAIVQRALGERTKPIALDPQWIAELIGALPAAQAAAVDDPQPARAPRRTIRSPPPMRSPQEWWTALVPPAQRSRRARGRRGARARRRARALPRRGLGARRRRSRARIATSRPRRCTSCGARATRSSRPRSARCSRLVERLGAAPEWLLDTWLLRIERALDLEAEHGAYLDGMIAGMPTVQRLLRGDERIGWELRLAHDLAVDPSQYEPAAMLFERCARAVEAGGVALAWSAAAARAAPPQAQLDVHWLAAMANPTGVAAPWLARRAAACSARAGRAKASRPRVAA